MDLAESDQTVVCAAMQRLGYDAPESDATITRLGDGQSGSSVWRIDLANQAVVLKITSATSDRTLQERAVREADFYRDLAHRVPLRVPKLVGLSLSEEGSLLLLEAAFPAPVFADWSETDFQRVAYDLGRLHGTFWDKANDVGMPGWLRQSSSVSAEQATIAEALWTEMVLPSDFNPQRNAMAHLALQVPALDRERATLPPTLCHGDAHRENLLQASTGEWLWADWQEVRRGQGVDDLAFFWQRAYVVTEAIPTLGSLVDAYQQGLVNAGLPPLPHGDLMQALSWSELRMWAIDWPAYLGWLSPTEVERVLLRTEALIADMRVDIGE